MQVGSCAFTKNTRESFIGHIVKYRQTYNIRRTFVGNIIVDNSICWSIACRRCSKYIFIIHLIPGPNGPDIDNCKTRWETFKFGAQMQPMRWFVMHHFQIKTSGSHRSFEFLFCLLHDSMYISPISFIGGVKTTREAVMCTISRSKYQTSMSHKSFQFVLCPLHGPVPIWPTPFTCGAHTTHDVIICREPFSGHKVIRSVWCSRFMASFLFDHFPSYGAPIQPTSRECVRYHFQVKVKVKFLIRSRSLMFCFHLNI